MLYDFLFFIFWWRSYVLKRHRQIVTINSAHCRTVGNIDIKLDFAPPSLINFLSRQLLGSACKLYQKVHLLHFLFRRDIVVFQIYNANCPFVSHFIYIRECRQLHLWPKVVGILARSWKIHYMLEYASICLTTTLQVQKQGSVRILKVMFIWGLRSKWNCSSNKVWTLSAKHDTR